MAWRAKIGKDGRGGGSQNPLKLYADEISEAEPTNRFDEMYFPSNDWMGHNSREFSGDEEQVMRGETPGRMNLFPDAPRIDIDPHMALLLLMGINDKISLRKHKTTKKATVKKDPLDPNKTITVPDVRIDPIDGMEAPDDLIWQHIASARRDGKTRMPVVLRFKDSAFYGKHALLEKRSNANVVEFPVIIDISKGAIHQWADADCQLLAKPDEGKAGTARADKLAQEYGYATIKDFRNSTPFQLNNPWLKRNESRDASKEGKIDLFSQRLAKLKTKIATAENNIHIIQAQIDELNTGIAANPEEQEKLDRTLERMAKAEQEVERLKPIVEVKREAMRDAYWQLNHLYDTENPVDRNSLAFKEQETTLRRTVAAANNDLLGGTYFEKQGRKNVRVEPDGEAKLNNMRHKTKRVRIEGLEANKASWEKTLDERQSEFGQITDMLNNTQAEKVKKHTYARTDHSPVPITLTVVASNYRDYIAQMDKEPLNGRHKEIEQVYVKDIYPMALDNEKGWLRDVFSKTPANPYLATTRRLFKHMHEEAVEDGKFTGDFESYITSPESPFHQHIEKIKDESLSSHMRDALADERTKRDPNYSRRA